MKSPTTMVQAGLFLEDVLTIRDNLRLVGGFRYDWLSLDRQNYRQNGQFNAATSFKGHYNPDNFRIGPVFDLTKNVSLYGVYTTGEDPPGSNLFLANRGQFTKLSHSRQGEIGVKASLWDGRLTTTLALYDIRRTRMLVSTGPDTVATAGVQKSRGVEWQGDLVLNRHWSLSGNVAYTYSRYGSFHPVPRLMLLAIRCLMCLRSRQTCGPSGPVWGICRSIWGQGCATSQPVRGITPTRSP